MPNAQENRQKSYAINREMQIRRDHDLPVPTSVDPAFVLDVLSPEAMAETEPYKSEYPPLPLA